MAKSYSGSSNSLVNTFTTLSQNSSSSNTTLGGILVNEQHKYLLLKFFDNERIVTITTSGATTATLTATLPSGATSAILTSGWPNQTAQQLVVFNGQQRNVQFNKGSTTIYWASPIATASATTAITTVGVQSYPLPANVSKVKTGTITIGQLTYTPAPVQSVQEWTKLNAIPYTSDIPAYFFIYNSTISFFPIPSSTGNLITIPCQIDVADMTYTDYTTGTLSSMPVNSYSVVGAGSTWSASFPLNVDLTAANLYLTATPPKGDGMLYPVQSFQSDTTLTLAKPITASYQSGATYTIGQYPLLSQDFHDAIVYGALRIYFSSIVKDPDRYNLYNGLFKEKIDLMTFYLANKQVNVDLSVTPVLTNPNLFYWGNGS